MMFPLAYLLLSLLPNPQLYEKELAVFSERLEKDVPCSHPDQRCSNPPLITTQEDLMVFISFSVPVETWQDLSHQLVRASGRFVLKGIPDHSFELFAAKVWQLRQAGVEAAIDIDPDLFALYNVSEVPMIVVANGAKNDRVAGNLRLDAALRLMTEEGDAQERARTFLKKAEER